MKISVWLHGKISGEGIPDPDMALGILLEQLHALRQSGLLDASIDLNLCLNGPKSDILLVSALAPEKFKVIYNGEDSRWETRTLIRMRTTIPPGMAVLYHHTKGVTHPSDDFHHLHRRTMQKYVVDNWRRCVADLERGYELVGTNLVDPVMRNVFNHGYRFYAGNFWWARSNWIRSLPVRVEDGYRINDEYWVCNNGSRRPICTDYERPELWKFWEDDPRVKPA